MLNAILCGTTSDKLDAIFRMCDINENGFIEKQELIHIIQVSFVILFISLTGHEGFGTLGAFSSAIGRKKIPPHPTLTPQINVKL